MKTKKKRFTQKQVNAMLAKQVKKMKRAAVDRERAKAEKAAVDRERAKAEKAEKELEWAKEFCIKAGDHLGLAKLMGLTVDTNQPYFIFK